MNIAADPHVIEARRKMDARERREAAESSAYRDLRDLYATAWLAGDTTQQLPTPGSTLRSSDSLAGLVAGDLVDLPGNALHALIQVAARAAKRGDAQAVRVIEQMAEDYAAEWSGEYGNARLMDLGD